MGVYGDTSDVVFRWSVAGTDSEVVGFPPGFRPVAAIPGPGWNAATIRMVIVDDEGEHEVRFDSGPYVVQVDPSTLVIFDPLRMRALERGPRLLVRSSAPQPVDTVLRILRDR